MIALSLALALTQPTGGPTQGPQKLVVAWAQGGVIAIDYPSWDRCQRAKEAVEAEATRRIETSRRNAPQGVIVGAPWIVYAFCIPA